MSAPDACEWYQLDLELPAVDEQLRASREFTAAHPEITFIRLTVLGAPQEEAWLCIEGWLTTPTEQGPWPTEADIPMGFI